MEREFLFKTAIPLAVALMVMIGIALVSWHSLVSTTKRAHTTFDQAMRGVAERLGVRFHPASEPNDWGGAGGVYRGHSVAVFFCSDEHSMRTGIRVRFAKPLPDHIVAVIKKQGKWSSYGKVLVIYEKRACAKLGLAAGTIERLQAMLSQVSSISIDADALLAEATEGSSFFQYEMLTDVDRIVALLDQAIDVTLALESE